MMTRVGGCIIIILSVLEFCIFITGTGAIELDTAAPLSVEVDSNFALYTIQNSTNGVVVTITPLCLSRICSPPHSLLVEDVFLPEECSVVPCSEHQLMDVTTLSDSTTQYVIGVPSNESLLLLRFHYHVQSGIFELKEKARVNKGIQNCSPTVFELVDEVFYTLCVNGTAKQFMVYGIDNMDNFQKVSFNPILDSTPTLTLPITDVSSVSGIADSDSNYFLFVGGSELSVVNIDDSQFDCTDFDECTKGIYRISPCNTSEVDVTIPYLLYCEQDYGVIDIRDIESSEPLRYNYSVTGYPVICHHGNTVVAEFTVFVNNMNNSLQYDGKNYSIPGHQILPNTSLCFAATGGSLLYVYSDGVLGSVLVSLRNDNFDVLFSEMCDWSSCVFRVVDARYVILLEQYNDTSIRLRLYDVLVRTFVSESTLNHTASLMQLISLPWSPPPNWLAVILGSTFGALFVLIICALVVLAIIYRNNNREAPPDDNGQHHRALEPQETDPLLPHERQVQTGNSPALPVFQSIAAVRPDIPERSPPTPLPFNTPFVPSTPNNTPSFLVSGQELPPVRAGHN